MNPAARRQYCPTLPRSQLLFPGPRRHFELTFLCGGSPFKVIAPGSNAQAAAAEGLLELASQCPDFEPDTARMVAAVEVR